MKDILLLLLTIIVVIEARKPAKQRPPCTGQKDCKSDECCVVFHGNGRCVGLIEQGEKCVLENVKGMDTYNSTCPCSGNLNCIFDYERHKYLRERVGLCLDEEKVTDPPITVPTLKPGKQRPLCTGKTDCKSDECCVVFNGVGSCVRLLEKGQKCSLSNTKKGENTYTFTCPCSADLTCFRDYRTELENNIGLCSDEKIVTDPPIKVPTVKPGKQRPSCTDKKDCKSDECCVVFHGDGSCVRLLEKGQKCILSNTKKGENAYQFTCPCSADLTCVQDYRTALEYNIGLCLDEKKVTDPPTKVPTVKPGKQRPSCTDQKDCTSDECCVVFNGVGSCVRLLEKGQRCILSNTKKGENTYQYTCPCSADLTCVQDYTTTLEHNIGLCSDEKKVVDPPTKVSTVKPGQQRTPCTGQKDCNSDECCVVFHGDGRCVGLLEKDQKCILFITKKGEDTYQYTCPCTGDLKCVEDLTKTKEHQIGICKEEER